MPRSIPMTLDMHYPFERRFRWAGPMRPPPAIPDPDAARRRADPGLRGYIGSGFLACKQAPGRRVEISGRRAEPLIVAAASRSTRAGSRRRRRRRWRPTSARVAAAAPFFAPLTPWGKPMSVRMTSAGRYGWFTDARAIATSTVIPTGRPGRRSRPRSSRSGARWSRPTRDPDCCLVNYYAATARMGLHRDADEKDFSWPVLSISLGDPALFPHGRRRAQGPDRLAAARERRRRGLRRPGPARLSRHRPHPLRRLDACCPKAAGST